MLGREAAAVFSALAGVPPALALRPQLGCPLARKTGGRNAGKLAGGVTGGKRGAFSGGHCCVK